MLRLLLAGVLVVLPALAQTMAAAPPDPVAAAAAKDFVGKRVTVCGKVVQIQKAFNRSERSFMLHLDTIDPKPIFVVMLGGSRVDSPFWNVERTYPDKDICATGYVRDRNGTPYMQILQPNDIRIVKPKD